MLNHCWTAESLFSLVLNSAVEEELRHLFSASQLRAAAMIVFHTELWLIVKLDSALSQTTQLGPVREGFWLTTKNRIIDTKHIE